MVDPRGNETAGRDPTGRGPRPSSRRVEVSGARTTTRVGSPRPPLRPGRRRRRHRPRRPRHRRPRPEVRRPRRRRPRRRARRRAPPAPAPASSSPSVASPATAPPTAPIAPPTTAPGGPPTAMPTPAPPSAPAPAPTASLPRSSVLGSRCRCRRRGRAVGVRGPSWWSGDVVSGPSCVVGLHHVPVPLLVVNVARLTVAGIELVVLPIGRLLDERRRWRRTSDGRQAGQRSRIGARRVPISGV